MCRFVINLNNVTIDYELEKSQEQRLKKLSQCLWPVSVVCIFLKKQNKLYICFKTLILNQLQFQFQP